MAMAAIGTVLLIVGGLVLLGGLGYVGYAKMDQEKNDEGVFTNPERGQDNKDRAYTGLYVAGAGLLLTLVGVVITIAGRRGSGGLA